MSVYRVALVDKDGHFTPFDLGQYDGVSSERAAIEQARKRYRGLFNRLSAKAGGTGKFNVVATLLHQHDKPRSSH